MKTPILILEGADCTGKTTLARALCKALNGAYLRSEGYPALCKPEVMSVYYRAVRNLVFENAAVQGRPVVLDRHWPSQVVYGAVLNRPIYDYRADMDWFTGVNAVYIYCQGNNLSREWQRNHKDTTGAQYSEEQYELLLQGYDTLFNGATLDYDVKRRVIPYSVGKFSVDDVLEMVKEKYV